MLPTQLEYVTALIGCFYAGLIAVPLHPPLGKRAAHWSRIIGVLGDAQPRAVVCDSRTCELLEESRREFPDGLAMILPEALGSTPEVAFQTRTSEVAFLQYTSGSTGRPKGVVVTHASLHANLRDIAAGYGFHEADSMLSWLPLYHDMGLVGTVLLTLRAGMTSYLMPTTAFMGRPLRWLQALSRFRVSSTVAPHFAYALLARTVNDADIEQLDLRSLEIAVDGAEPVDPRSLTEFVQRFAAAGLRPSALHPSYGLAEVTLFVSTQPRGQSPRTFMLDSAALEQGTARVAERGVASTPHASCGTPRNEATVRIVDPATGEACGPARVGEIWYSGPSAAVGYWGQDSLSVATFGATLNDDPRRWLRTGDLGCWIEGELVICGRLKDLIVQSGRNVYPQDIEHAIAHGVPDIRLGRVAAFSVPCMESVTEQIVVAAEPRRRRADPRHHAELFAAIRHTVRDAVDCRVDRIVFVEPGSLPMTTSGKVARQVCRAAWLAKELSAVADSHTIGFADSLDPGSAEASASMPPIPAMASSPVLDSDPELTDRRAVCEKVIRAQLCALLPGQPIDASLSLTAHGVDSLGVVTLSNALESRFGWCPSYEALLGDHSLSELAEVLAARLGEATRVPIPRGIAPAVVPQSSAQRRLWFAYRMDPTRSAHNLVASAALRGPLDRLCFEQAFAHLVRAHGVLRTRYLDGVEAPLQHVSDVPPEAPRWHDWSEGGDAETAWSSLLAAEQETPFDLERDAPMRAQLVRFGPNHHRLVLAVHHIAFDGRSAELFLDELARTYAALAAGYVIDSSSLPLQYADYALWEQESEMRVESSKADLVTFWRSYLDGWPSSLAIGRSMPGPPVAATLARVSSTLHLLDALCRNHGVTRFMGLLTVFVIALRHRCGSHRFVIGTDVEGRDHPELAESIGFFVNQLAITCEATGDPTLGELLARIGASARRAYAHQSLPFERVVRAVAPNRATSARAPVFDIKLVYQREVLLDREAGAIRIADVQVRQSPGDFDCVLAVTARGSSAELCFRYNASRFSEREIEQLADSVTHVLEQLPRGPARSLTSLLDELARRDAAMEATLQRDFAAAARAKLGVRRRRPVGS